MNITRNSNFSAELDKVKAFYNGLEQISTTYKGTIVSIQDKITGFSCSSWTDNVGDEMLTLIKGIKESEIVTLDDNMTIGGFKKLVDNTVALKDALGNCVTCEAQINRDEATMASEARKKTKDNKDYSSLYYSAKRDKENTETQLNGLIETANSLIKNYPNIHFNGAGGDNDGSPSDGSDGTPEVPTSGLRPFDQNPDLLYDTFEYMDPETGEMITYEILVDPKTGSIIVGNESKGYRIYAKDGASLYPGYIKKNAINGEYNINNVAYLLTDGHQSDKNGLFEVSSAAYGRNGEIYPMPSPGAKPRIVEINGTKVPVCVESSNGPINQYFDGE